MNWIDKLERKFGKYAIPNLMFYVIILCVAGFILDLISPGFYGAYLALDASAIMRGQVWRLLTFLIQPPDSSALFMLLALYLYYFIGQALESVWGRFRFNLYFITGVLLHIVAAFLAYFIFKITLPLGTYYLNMSLFFAFAAIFPNQQFYLFMIVPIKVKWIAWLDAVFFGYAILQAFLPAYGGNPYFGYVYKARALEAFIAILNFLIFYFSMRRAKFSPKEIKRRREYKSQVRQGEKENRQGNGARHRCTVCGRTELDDENLEFRYCSKCNGNYEYCQDHLFTHEHIK
jgi:hypothetical protein